MGHTNNNQLDGASEVDSKGVPSIFTIYCHIHIESGRRYVGLTKRTILQRWNDHCYAAKSSKNGRWHFPNAIRLYGKDAFDHEVLEVCNTLEEANIAEVKWIDFYNTRDPKSGFNLSKGGDHVPHPIRKNPWDDPEFRIKMIAAINTSMQNPMTLQHKAEASKKMWSDPNFQAKHSAVMAQVMNTSEFKTSLSEAMKRVAATPDGRAQRIAAAHLGKILNADHRAKISKNNATKRQEVLDKLSIKSRAAWSDPEKRERMSSAHIGKKVNSETRAKLSMASRGRKLSDKTKLKISTALTKRPRQTHCKRGHIMNEDNILVTGNRHRCRICRNIRQ